MNVFVNVSAQPTLAVGELLGNTQQGGLGLHVPAAFANLPVSFSETDGLSPIPVPDRVGSDTRIAHSWLLGHLTTLHYELDPTSYGWGLSMRSEDTRGLGLSTLNAARTL